MKEIGTLKEENDWNEMASDQRNWKVQVAHPLAKRFNLRVVFKHLVAKYWQVAFQV